jgi:hypothetical protein
LVLVESFRLCSLQSVRMDRCEFADSNIALDPLVRAFATIPTLETLSLSRTKLAPEGKVWTCQCLQHLMPHLRSLSLSEMPDLQHDQLCLLAVALEEPSAVLKELKIQKQELSDHCLSRIGSMLCKTPSLQELSIDVKSTDQVISITKNLAREKSSSLLRLSFPGEWGQQEGDDYCSEIRRVLLDMVQTNAQLTHLVLGNDKCMLSQETSNYISMNTANQLASIGKRTTRHAPCPLPLTETCKVQEKSYPRLMRMIPWQGSKKSLKSDACHRAYTATSPLNQNPCYIL